MQSFSIYNTSEQAIRKTSVDTSMLNLQTMASHAFLSIRYKVTLL